MHRALQSRETSPPRSERLDSWKEIAAYLGRHVRTLHLWEKAEKLPVHRHIHSKRGTVYAFKSELDVWKQARTLLYTNRNGAEGRLRTDAIEMIGVLPFENLSGDASQEYLGDGLTEEVISQLGRIRPEQLRVIARTSSMHYKNSDKSIAVLAEELGVAYLLEGSVRRNKGRIRVTVTLIRAADQVNLWSESYDRDLADIFELQMDVAGRIAASVVSELVPIQPVAQFTRPPRPDTQAYEAYLCALNYNRQRTEESLLKAVHYFNRAIQKDPSLTVAYAGLADAYVLLSVYGVMPALEVMPLAKASALRAVGNTPELAEAHATLGQILSVCDWEWDAAHKEYKLALELNPSYPAAHHYFAEYLAVIGEREKALQQIDLACSLDPRSVIASVWRGNLLRLCGRPKEAVRACIATVKLDPNYVLAHWALGLAYEQIGRLSEALSEFRSAAQLSGRNPGVLSALGHCQAVAGLLDEARETLQQLQLLSARRYIPAYEFAIINVGLGDEDQAVEFIGKAFEERSPWLMMLPLEPRLAHLKSHPRFDWLLSSLNLPDPAHPVN